MSESFVLINDELVPSSKASLLISDLSIQRGYGIFDFFKTLHNTPVFFEAHMDRFFRSADNLRLPIGKDRSALKEMIRTLMGKNNIPDSGIRLTLTGGYSPDGYELARPNLIVTQQPLKLPAKEVYEKGIRLVTYSHVRQMPDTKTIDYLMAIWLQPYIKENGADDVLYHQNGIVSECPRMNFFIVTAEDTIVTPSRNILHGIVRRHILELARKQWVVEERDVSLEDIRTAKEAFITSTTKNALPVQQVDGRPIGNGKPGKITTWLNTALRELAIQST